MKPYVYHDYIELGGLRTHLIRSGPRVDTVFLHGVGGSCWTFEHTLSALKVDLHWASIDLLGYGESSWLPGDEEYSTKIQAGRVCEVLDCLGATRVNLVGFSWGGLIALEVAAQRSAVDRLVVIDIPPSSALAPEAVAPIPWRCQDTSATIEAMGRLAPNASRRILERDALLSTTFDELGLRRKLDPRLLKRYVFRAEDHWTTWDAIKCPTLLIRGQNSPVLSSEAAAMMRQRAPSVSFVEIPETGHMIPLEQPDRLAKAVGEFCTNPPDAEDSR
jgi:pimeloyl-ACP methyl ester carboxylesterase